MNKRLSEAIVRLRALPDDRQHEIADLLIAVLGHETMGAVLTSEQVAEIEARLESDDVATDEEVTAFFERYRRSN
jgi:hypothetical protein